MRKEGKVSARCEELDMAALHSPVDQAAGLRGPEPITNWPPNVIRFLVEKDNAEGAGNG